MQTSDRLSFRASPKSRSSSVERLARSPPVHCAYSVVSSRKSASSQDTAARQRLRPSLSVQRRALLHVLSVPELHQMGREHSQRPPMVHWSSEKPFCRFSSKYQPLLEATNFRQLS